MVGPAIKAELEKLPQEIQDSALGAVAKSLAQIIDDGDVSASAKASLYRTLLETLDRLRSLAPAEEEEDKVDELRARRAKRRATA